MNKIHAGACSILLACTVIFGSGCSGKGKGGVSGDSLFIPKEYKQELMAKGLDEVAPMAYFKSPFISIAQDGRGDQFAVVFRENAETEVVPLPVKYEELLALLEQKGFKKVDKSPKPASFTNLHVFEMNKGLYWRYEEGDRGIWLDIQGKEADPFNPSPSI